MVRNTYIVEFEYNGEQVQFLLQAGSFHEAESMAWAIGPDCQVVGEVEPPRPFLNRLRLAAWRIFGWI